jgi:lipoprotein Spr
LRKSPIILVALLATLSSCSFIGQLQTSTRIKRPEQAANNSVSNAKFLPAITTGTTVETASVSPEKKRVVSVAERTSTAKLSGPNTNSIQLREDANIQPNELNYRAPYVETASPLQLKYAVLLNAEVESLPNENLLTEVEDWYGTKYRHGGATKKGIDCSAFTMTVYEKAYCYSLPRTSREQYSLCKKISADELQEGDLVFFNIRGRGVSHVGIYLGNNKFIHASVSNGVMVSDLTENYYSRRFLGAGRVEDPSAIASGN